MRRLTDDELDQVHGIGTLYRVERRRAWDPVESMARHQRIRRAVIDCVLGMAVGAVVLFVMAGLGS